MVNFKEWLVDRFVVERKSLTDQVCMLIHKELWHIILIK